MTEHEQIRALLAAPFDDVKWRLQQTSPKNAKGQDGRYQPGTRGLFMAYIDARQLFDRLDEVIGFGNWQREIKQINPDGSVVGTISIRINDQWIEHDDIGYSNNPGASHETEPLKAAASDAFKRAGVGLGIGRFLYELEAKWKPIDEWGKPLADLNTGELPPRTSTTSQNTIPAKEPVGTENTVDAWTVFWRKVEDLGLPRDKKSLEAQIGTSIGINPQLALEKVQAWAHDNARQPALS